jgi:hypothetical protein
MKNHVFIIYLLLISCFGKGQDLVPNYSFENYTACPSAGGQLNLASPWMAIPANDVEYFNSCSTDPIYSVPNQGSYNFQVAKTGNAYIGFISYHGVVPNYREYAQVALSAPLQINTCYYVEFFINRLTGTAGGQYSNNNIACSFTNTAVTNTGTGYVLNLTPHVIKFENPIIQDTVNWIQVSGVFVANGTESFLTIGNFFNDVNTDTLNLYDGTYPSATYFIDDVSVIPIDSMPAFAGNDTNVVIGDSVFIGQEISNLNCNWYNAAGTLIASNISGIYVQPTSDTYYVVEQNLCGTITYDTVNVNVSGVGINENKFNSIKVYPNPSTGNISFELSNSDVTELNIKVIDVTGKIVFDKTINSGERMFNLSLDVPNGIYMLFINDPNTNERIVKRIVIQK